MSRIRIFVALVSGAVLAGAAPLSALTRSTANSATLDAAVATAPATARATVTAALSSSRVIAVAGRMGISQTELAARVAALDDASIQQLNDRILAGGSTVVISTTAIIIVLLLILLLR
jgi:ABC-type Co2+ transport system permease subunit